MNYSSFGRRLIALVIDSCIMALPSLLFTGMSRNIVTSMVAGAVLGFFYYPIFESSIMSATPGKALMGMTVVTVAGERIDFKTALIRWACHYLSLVLMYAGYLMQPFTEKKQTLHDMISGTVVVDFKSEDINYFKAWGDQFKAIFNRL